MRIDSWRSRRILLLTCLLLCFALSGVSLKHLPRTAQPVGRYGALPLTFELNRGQTDSQVKFLARAHGYTLFLTATEAVLALRGPGQNVLRMQLIGADPAAQATGRDLLPGKSNYLAGNDPKNWHTDVPHYAAVRYGSIYPGVDLVYYGRERQLEYDFVVAPGTDPSIIRLAFQGVTPQRHEDGSLMLRLPAGELRLHRPVIYQEAEGIQRTVPGGYVLKGENEVGFEIGEYDHGRPLVIDPVLIYSTYLGGSSIDLANSIAVDTTGNAYVAGSTSSANFPIVNPLQSTPGSDMDAFVVKVDATGSALVYATYLGGSAADSANSIAVDGAGNAYVVGSTDSNNFPTASPLQGARAGSTDAFVLKLNAAGSALTYSTYVGGNGMDFGNSIAVDTDRNAYITGATNSSNFPTVNPLQGTPGGADDAFVAKLNAAGSALVYSTLLGGNGSERGSGVAVDTAGNAYVTGPTNSTNFPTANPLQGTPGGETDAFVAKVNATGSALTYSTYLGGSLFDIGNGIAVDSSGNAYVTGATQSLNFPTVNAVQATNGGFVDVFVSKLNATGSAFLYSTYLGGFARDEGYGISANNAGLASVTGRADSGNFPVVSAFQVVCGGCQAGGPDGFVARIDTTSSGAASVLYSSFFGGTGNGGDPDVGFGIAVDGAGNAYVAGLAATTGAFPITPGSLQTSSRGSSDALVLKIGPNDAPGFTLTRITVTFGDQGVGGTSAPQSVSFGNGGSAPLSITSITANGDFNVTSNCGASVSGGGICNLQVSFAPTATGLRTGSITVVDNAAGSPHMIALTGTGSTNLAAMLTPATIVFNDQTVGVLSPSQTATLTNSGAVSLTIQSISIDGSEFFPNSNCPSNLAPNASCTISVTFQPAALGLRTATLTVFTGAAGSPHIVALSGTGVTAPDVTISPLSLNFAPQIVNTTSASQTVTLSATGSGTLAINGIGTSGDFAQTNTCGGSIAGGSSCTINVGFRPTAVGNLAGTLTIMTNAAGSPHLVPLTGSGTDFSITSSPMSATVTSGQPATYTLTVTPQGGFTGTVTLTCSGAPRDTTCSISPSSVTISGPNSSTAMATVATSPTILCTSAPPSRQPSPFEGPPLLPWLLLLILLACLKLARQSPAVRGRRTVAALAILLLAVLLYSACGGGDNTPPCVESGTPRGQHSFTFSAASGGATRSATSTLTVN